MASNCEAVVCTAACATSGAGGCAISFFISGGLGLAALAAIGAAGGSTTSVSTGGS